MKLKTLTILSSINILDEIFFRFTNPKTCHSHDAYTANKINMVKPIVKKIKNIIQKITPISTRKKTILIAEDEEFNFLYLKTILSSHNFNLLRAHNGKEAVRICKSNSEIDLILMDIKMPVMNGFEATSKIKKSRPDVPIIAQTAYSTKNDRNKAYESGCSDFISKPFTQEDLLEKIKTYI